MAYLAIARKWRPSRFEDLVGQNHVVQTLKNAITFQRVSHAYLFSGARGVGKTSVARIFAMALRCPNVKEGTPCNTCEECRAIIESRSVDVVEIDGASNNGVEAVRGIRENVAYAPSSGTYKIYIIDEVHMLSLSAFNALLKTLEEPPEHVIFVFATTEVQKIPVTILSRCQRFEFRRLTSPQIVERLIRILKEENLKLTDEALRTLAAYGDGSLRDSLSLLDQVLSYYSHGEGKTSALDEKQVVEALGLSDTSTVLGFLSAVVSKDTAQILKLVGDTYQSGVDLKRFAERTLEELRLLFLLALAKDGADKPTAEALDLSTSHFSAVEALAKQVSLTQVERMSQILGKAIQQIGWSSLPRYVLEMAAIRMSKLDLLEQIEKSLASGGGIEVPAAAAPAARPAPAPAAAPPARPAASPSASASPPPSARPSPAPSSGPPPGPPPIGNAAPGGAKTWQGFVDAVMKRRPLLGAILCHAEFQLKPGEGCRIALVTFPEGSFYERQAKEAKNRSDTEELLKGFFGPDVRLELSSGKGEEIKSIEQGKQAEAAQIRQEALQHPTVVKMKEMLGAEVIDVNVEV
jgi:DNA polymerase III subunit gamma/tau